MYQDILVQLIEAALDQPKPTKQLVTALNDALRLLNHPLAQFK